MTSTSPLPGALAADFAAARAAAVETVRQNITAFGENPGNLYPNDTTNNGHYELRPAIDGFTLGANRGWTTSFWPGMQWLAWELTGDDTLRTAAERHAADFARRVREGDDLETHDLGFLYSLASVTTSRLAADPQTRSDARDAALLAADHLMRRFLEPAGVIQAWGDLTDPAQAGRTIIDSLMNMPLLTWAYEQTGDERFADAVRRHTVQLRENILRADDSTFHTFYWDVETGEALRGGTEQGAFDDSCWARGQAWGVYGFAINYRATGDESLLDTAWRCAEYFLAHLPEDGVPYWDLVYPEGSEAPRDSSSAAIAASGFLELARVDPDPVRAERAHAAALDLLTALVSGYTPASAEESNALLLHGVYDMPKDVGVDEGTLWGDYFFLEALSRLENPEWVTYW